jgi:hypothetical protein
MPSSSITSTKKRFSTTRPKILGGIEKTEQGLMMWRDGIAEITKKQPATAKHNTLIAVRDDDGDMEDTTFD